MLLSHDDVNELKNIGGRLPLGGEKVVEQAEITSGLVFLHRYTRKLCQTRVHCARCRVANKRGEQPKRFGPTNARPMEIMLKLTSTYMPEVIVQLLQLLVGPCHAMGVIDTMIAQQTRDETATRQTSKINKVSNECITFIKCGGNETIKAE